MGYRIAKLPITHTPFFYSLAPKDKNCVDSSTKLFCLSQQQFCSRSRIQCCLLKKSFSRAFYLLGVPYAKSSRSIKNCLIKFNVFSTETVNCEFTGRKKMFRAQYLLVFKYPRQHNVYRFYPTVFVGEVYGYKHHTK